MATDPPRFPLIVLLRGCVAGVVLAFALHFAYVLLAGNFRTTDPGRVYRCAQPSRRQLERIIRTYGIRTIINLRGACPGTPWYNDEAAVSGDLGVSQEDLNFSAGRLPSPSGLLQLIEVLDRTAYPILVHCHQGADRTGLTAVVYCLVRTNATLAEARRHLGPKTGHLPLGRTQHIDHFFDLYEKWLDQQGRTHSPDVFRLWARHYYCPDEGRAEFALLEPGDQKRSHLHLCAGTGRLVKVRCRNRSICSWQMHPRVNAGIHGIWFVMDEQERHLGEGRVGLLEATVPPGEFIDLMVPLPALPAGRFQLRVDLFSAQHASFLQLGNEPLLVDVEVS